MPTLHLLPTPKELRLHAGAFKPPSVGWIILEPSDTARDLFPAAQLAQTLESLTHTPWKVAGGTKPISPTTDILCRHDPSIPHAQGYRLHITPRSITLAARSPAGMFYAMQTLIQIVRQSPRRWPALTINDWPDFPRRGVYHDISRGKVPELGTILQLIDDLAALKINEFQLYIENVFEFRRHPKMVDDTTPLTAEELRIIDDACRRRHIDFVPSLTSLGHFEKILRRPAFRKLAEAEPAVLKAQGMEVWSDEPWSLCVTDPAARRLLADMYDEFLPNFTSPWFNICCDEAWDLGKGRSRKLAEKIGVPQLYVDWINYCAGMAADHGKKIMLWGDIIRNHPEKIAQLPPNAALIEWGYEGNHDFDGRCKLFAERATAANPPGQKNGGGDEEKRSGTGGRGAAENMPDGAFYVSPGTSTWLTLAGRTQNAFANMHAAATAGLKYGAAGFLNTDWGDNGHQQMLAVSLLPFAYGAAVSWNTAATPHPTLSPSPSNPLSRPRSSSIENRKSKIENFLDAASLHVFHDPSLHFAHLAYDLGLTYLRFGWQRFNASVDWFLFREKWDFANYVNRVHPADLHKVITATQKLLMQFAHATLTHPDADLLRQEFLFTAREIIHVARRTLIRQQWLAADPAKRNPQDERGQLLPIPLKPKPFTAELNHLTTDAAALAETFQSLWLARNKPSRLTDVLAEFTRIATEYKSLSKKKARHASQA